MVERCFAVKSVYVTVTLHASLSLYIAMEETAFCRQGNLNGYEEIFPDLFQKTFKNVIRCFVSTFWFSLVSYVTAQCSRPFWGFWMVGPQSVPIEPTLAEAELLKLAQASLM